MRSLVVFFFFQAEDGIRDSSVTGVQTCALPIYVVRDSGIDAVAYDIWVLRRDALRHRLQRAGIAEIGRASCRERVSIGVVVVAEEKKKRRGVRGQGCMKRKVMLEKR